MTMMQKKLLPLLLAAGLVLWPGSGQAAPIVGNAPHRADGTVITARPRTPNRQPASAPTPARQPETAQPATAAAAGPAAAADKPNRQAAVLKDLYRVGDHAWMVKMAQGYLEDLGYDPGTANGDFTKATRKALKKFQKKEKGEGLRSDGNLDMETYQCLKRKSAEKKYGKAYGSADSRAILATAARYRGTRYVFGGTSPSGFDCSGYVQYVFARHGIQLTRTADTQAKEGVFVPRAKLQPGDLVFFTTYAKGASHDGIYAGNGKFWNATSHGVMLSDMNDSYWSPRYYTARRILGKHK